MDVPIPFYVVVVPRDRQSQFLETSDKQWTEKLMAAVAQEEAKAADVRKTEGRRVLGSKAVRRQSPFSHPKTTSDRRRLRPRVASKNKWRRIEMLQRNRHFQDCYRRAYTRRAAGDVDVLFPYGSYKLRLQGLVRCEPPSLQ